jgi:hypothetical protein
MWLALRSDATAADPAREHVPPYTIPDLAVVGATEE